MNKIKPVLDWLKENWLNVALLAVAVIALPVMFFVANSMSGKVRAAVEKDIATQTKDLAGVKVDYALEPLIPGEKPLSVSMPPNQPTTEAMKALLIKTKEQAAAVKARVSAFNKGDRAPMIEGLFPAPENKIDESPLADDMAKKRLTAHEALLKRHGGTPPPDPAEVAQRIDELRFRLEETTKATRADGQLTADDRKTITESLSRARIELYSARALQSRFYADPSIFVGVKPWDGKESPTLEQCWEWQWQYWAHEMVVRGLASANQDGAGIFGGALKRIERMEVAPHGDKGPGGEAPSDPTAATPNDPSKSLSTRVAWPLAANGLYDIRYVDVTLLAASDKLPRIIDALGESNLMSVVAIDVTAVDNLAEHLQQGYAYTRGGEHIVRVRMRIETVWLREWLAAWMPDAVKSRLGYPGVAHAAVEEHGGGGGGPPAGGGKAGSPTPPKAPGGMNDAPKGPGKGRGGKGL